MGLVAGEGEVGRETAESAAPLRLVPGQQVRVTPGGPDPDRPAEPETRVEPETPAGPETRAEPPLHTRTFLIADVRGYTGFTAARGDEAAGALAARFAALTRAVVAEYGGRLLELRGDEALVVFGSARAAIRAALGLRERFVAETLADPALPLPVGIGLDVGEAVEVEGGYRGGALNLAARLCGVAAPGEVLASREVTHLARHVEGARYVERGRVALKGLAEPVAVVRVLAQTVDAEREAAFRAVIAAPRTRRRPGGRLLVAGVVLAVLAAAGTTYLLVRDPATPAALSTGNRVDVIDPATGDIVEQVPLDQQPSDVAAGEGALWVTQAADGTVSRLDPGSRAVERTSRSAASPPVWWWPTGSCGWSSRAPVRWRRSART